VLELRIGGLPFPHGRPDGQWHYRHAVRQEGPTDLDRQAVADFLDYEEANGRTVVVVADPSLSDWREWGRPALRPVPGSCPTQCCSHVYAEGCGARLLCHGTPARTLADILNQGVLYSSTTLTERTAEDLACSSSWGEPPDYFDYVMLANGRCVAPEAVALSRLMARDLVPADLGPGYPPAARLYFTWDTLAALPDVCFDGVHPIKVRNELPLDETLVAVVVPEGTDVELLPSEFADRVIRVAAQDPSPEAWASRATRAALQLLTQ